MHVEVSTGKDASRVFAQVASEALQRREVALASMSQPVRQRRQPSRTLGRTKHPSAHP